MTGGRVVVLGKTGKNFAAGMSGGIAYVLDVDNVLYKNLNKAMISIEKVENKYDKKELRDLIEAHVEATGSKLGKKFWLTLITICLTSRNSFRMSTRR